MTSKFIRGGSKISSASIEPEFNCEIILSVVGSNKFVFVYSLCAYVFGSRLQQVAGGRAGFKLLGGVDPAAIFVGNCLVWFCRFQALWWGGSCGNSCKRLPSFYRV